MAVESSTTSKGRRTPAGKDVTSHLNKAEAATLAALDAKTRDRKTEKGYVVNDRGEIVAESYKAQKRRAVFHTSDGSKMKNAIITHNHPNAELDGTMAGRVGLPLSGQDIRTSIEYDAKEIRAVTPSYTYSIRRPPGGWPKIPEKDFRNLEDWKRDAGLYMTRKNFVYKEGKNAGRAKGSRSSEAKDRANVGTQSKYIREFAKEHGLIYSRARTR